MNKIIQFFIYILIIIFLLFGLYFFQIIFIPDFLISLKTYIDTKNSQKQFDRNARNNARESGEKYEKVETVYDRFKQSWFGKLILIIIVLFLIYKFSQFLTYAGFPILGASYLSFGSSYLTPTLNSRFFIDSEISNFDINNFKIYQNENIEIKNEIISSWYGKIFITIGKVIQSFLSMSWLSSIGWLGTIFVSFKTNQDLLLLNRDVFTKKYNKQIGFWRKMWKFILWFTTLGLDREVFKQIRPYENTLMSWNRKSLGLVKYWFYIFIFMMTINTLPLSTLTNSNISSFIFGNLNNIFYITLIIIIFIIAYKKIGSIWMPGNDIEENIIQSTDGEQDIELQEIKSQQTEQQVQTGGEPKQTEEDIIKEEQEQEQTGKDKPKLGKKQSIKNSIVNIVFDYEQYYCKQTDKKQVLPVLVEKIKYLENYDKIKIIESSNNKDKEETIKEIKNNYSVKGYSCSPNNKSNFEKLISSNIPENPENLIIPVIENTTFDEKLKKIIKEEFTKSKGGNLTTTSANENFNNQKQNVQSLQNVAVQTNKISANTNNESFNQTKISRTSTASESIPLITTNETQQELSEIPDSHPVNEPINELPITSIATNENEPVTEPVTEPITEPVTEPVTAPVTESVPITPSTNPETESIPNQKGGNKEDFDVKKVKKMKIPKIENFEHIFYDKSGDPIYVDVEGFLHKITDFRIQNKKKKVILN